MNRGFTTITHPHGYMLTQDECKFGFVRISKNGSTSISHVPEFQLKKWSPIQGFQGGVYAALRDPVDRFLSSIPETLMRYRHPNGSGKVNKKNQDISISYDVYDFFNYVKIDKIDHFLLQYIELIESYGYFDAHHEPQVDFITNLNGALYHDIFLFDIAHSEHALKTIARVEGLNENIKVERANSGSNNLMRRYNPKTVLFKIWKAKKNDNDYSYNPMYRWSSINNIPFSHARVEFYKKIKELRLNQYICSRIEGLYEDDMSLFNQTVQSNKKPEDVYFLPMQDVP